VRALAIALLSSFASGCGARLQSVEPAGTVMVVEVPSAPPQSNAAALPPRSAWEGRYVCAQGVTGLVVTIDPIGAEEVAATFRFFAVAENPSVPSGSYTMRGVLSAGTGAVQLVPERWIQRPPGYVMVGMTGLFDLRSGVMQGRIDAPSCGPFELRRTR
jgi:hypothetical protein